MTDSTRNLYGFELEPEVRDWLDGLSDSDYKRVDEVCGLLAEQGTELGGPWSDHLDGSVRELRVRHRDVAARATHWHTPDGTIAGAGRVPQDPPARAAADRPGRPRAEDLRARPPRHRDGDLRKAGATITGYHTRWARPEQTADDPERIAIREALGFGKALYDIRVELGLSVAEVAARAAMTEDDIERIEEGGTEPTVPLLRRLAAALNATVHLTPGEVPHDSRTGIH